VPWVAAHRFRPTGIRALPDRGAPLATRRPLTSSSLPAAQPWAPTPTAPPTPLQYPDICWRGAPDAFGPDLLKVFPTASLAFAGGATLQLPPHRYLFLVAKGEYCLGVFDNGQAGTLIGGIAVRNALVTVRGRSALGGCVGRGERGRAC
jgi:hypothetical protein